MIQNELFETYGEKLNAAKIERTLEHIFLTNDQINISSTEQRGTPICIWGLHGIGKTELVRGFARKKGWQFAYCAPAQFEEMGDLHGLPEKADDASQTTVYLPPAWVPREEGPGILLLDDFNRADIRILRGCMQLLQQFSMFSWSLPKRWQIVCTANPDGGDYSVTPLDDAMLTRLMHLTMVFEAKSWAMWALEHNIDKRGIDFVLTFPEYISGGKTTARSFTHFLQQIAHLQNIDNEQNLEMIQIIGKGFIDDEVVQKFMHFIRFIQQTMIQPEEILNSQSFDEEIRPRLQELLNGDGQGRRIDRLKTICTRLQVALCHENYTPQQHHKENLLAFLLYEEMDASLRFGLHHELVNAKNYTSTLQPLLHDARLAQIVLDAM